MALHYAGLHSRACCLCELGSVIPPSDLIDLVCLFTCLPSMQSMFHLYDNRLLQVDFFLSVQFVEVLLCFQSVLRLIIKCDLFVYCGPKTISFAFLT